MHRFLQHNCPASSLIFDDRIHVNEPLESQGYLFHHTRDLLLSGEEAQKRYIFHLTEQI